MKNREKYAKQIIDIVLSDNDIAISRKLRSPISCFNYECENCLRSIGGTEETCGIGVCSFDRLCKWAEEEYKEPIKLTPKQVQELEYYRAHGYTYVILKQGYGDTVILKSNNGRSLMARSICTYPQLENNKNYDIHKLLEDNKNEE